MVFTWWILFFIAQCLFLNLRGFTPRVGHRSCVHFNLYSHSFQCNTSIDCQKSIVIVVNAPPLHSIHEIESSVLSRVLS